MSGLPGSIVLARYGRAIAALQYIERRIARGDGPIRGFKYGNYQDRIRNRTRSHDS